MALQEWFALPEYERFIVGAPGAGFVCNDLAPMKDFEDFNARPREHLSSSDFSQLRLYVHTLLRAERWADGYATPIREAVMSGALEIVADRLASDRSLREVDDGELANQ